jgi:nucleoside-diphosphate-sugar epimerase
LALENAPAGTRLHGVADEGVPFRDIAGVIGRHLNVPVVSIASEQAPDHFGFLAAFAGLDNPTSNALTQKVLDWHPERPGLIEDLDEGHYFSE